MSPGVPLRAEVVVCDSALGAVHNHSTRRVIARLYECRAHPVTKEQRVFVLPATKAEPVDTEGVLPSHEHAAARHRVVTKARVQQLNAPELSDALFDDQLSTQAVHRLRDVVFGDEYATKLAQRDDAGKARRADHRRIYHQRDTGEIERRFLPSAQDPGQLTGLYAHGDEVHLLEPRIGDRRQWRDVPRGTERV
jgi:hypothetical protein